MLPSDRKLLAQQESEFLRYLTELAIGNAALVDDEALEETAALLLQKRCRAIEHCLPYIKNALGEKFDSAFLEFARNNPSVHKDGPHADAKSFEKYLKGHGFLRPWLVT